MKTVREMIEVMEAFDRGERVEVFTKGKWVEHCKPLWDWFHFDYRVKPKTKKKYVPFDKAEEFLAAQREHGSKVRPYEGGSKFLSFVDCDGNVILYEPKLDNSKRGTFNELLLCRWVFLDRTPCGKEVEE